MASLAMERLFRYSTRASPNSRWPSQQRVPPCLAAENKSSPAPLLIASSPPKIGSESGGRWREDGLGYHDDSAWTADRGGLDGSSACDKRNTWRRPKKGPIDVTVVGTRGIGHRCNSSLMLLALRERRGGKRGNQPNPTDRHVHPSTTQGLRATSTSTRQGTRTK